MAIPLGRVVGQLDFGNRKFLRVEIAVGIAITGLGQQFFGADRIERIPNRLGVSREDPFRRERRERLDGALVGGEPDFVDRHVERLAHADVVHRRLGRVQHVVVNRALRAVHEIDRAAEMIDPRGGRNVVVQGVNLARLVQVHHRRRVFHRIERNRLEPDVRHIPVLGAANVDELVVRLPGLQGERAASDDVLRLRPGLAEGLDGLAGDRPEKLMRDETREKRHRLHERELDGAIVDSRDADVFSLSLAFVIGLCAFDVVREVRGARGKLGRETAP